MSNLKTLDKVVELAEQRRDAALATMAQLEREMQAAQDQMNQLESYSLEAQQRWAARSGGTIDPTVLGHQRQFVQKIDHAIAFQRSVLSSRQDQIDRQLAVLQSAERDLAGLRRYTERKRQQVASQAMRQEQKQTDEMAMSVYLRQRSGAVAPTGGLST